MPRIRTIKPEFWSSPDTAKASPMARLLYIAMWNWADDYGIGTANMKELAAFAFPNDDHPTTSEIPSLCKEVADCYGAVFYMVRERPFYAIPAWDQHQKTERRANRRNPGPDDPGASPDLRIHETAEVPSLGKEVPCNDEESHLLEQGNRGTGEQSSSSEPDGSDAGSDEPYREDVEKVCQHLYDRIVANGSKPPTIGKTWRRSARLLIDKDHRTVEQIIAAIDWCQDDEFWRANILSMPTLREKYDKLRLAAQREKPKPSPERLTFGGGDRPQWEI